ncbi:MAG: hypothetical protein J3R72DRAFT_152849 [Linnemannia gamsii]|nr:MAG: hypothetical protein J3R72DRAFT_152849 [Linnemannia gamsii]
MKMLWWHHHSLRNKGQHVVDSEYFLFLFLLVFLLLFSLSFLSSFLSSLSPPQPTASRTNACPPCWQLRRTHFFATLAR